MLYQPSCASFPEGVFVADQEDLGTVFERSQEVVARFESRCEVVKSIDGRVHGSPDLLFDRGNGVKDFVE